MGQLVLKINRGAYPDIEAHYSREVKELLAQMLAKDPMKRPSMRKILEKPFIAKRIPSLFSKKFCKEELSATFIGKFLNPLLVISSMLHIYLG